MKQSPSIYDPSTRQEIESKQDRILVVQRLPGNAKEGAQVVLDDDVYVFRSGRWYSPTKSLRDRIAALEGVEALDVSKLTSDLNAVNQRIVNNNERTALEGHRQLQESANQAISFYPSTRSLLGRQSARTLSPLERDVIRFVFGEDGPVDPDSDELCIEVIYESEIEDFGYSASYFGPLNLISMARRYFPLTQQMDADATIDDIDPVDMQNVGYLGTFVHEVTHRWQDLVNYKRLDNHSLGYDFQTEDVNSKLFADEVRPELAYTGLGNEQHASAIQTWFGINWQLQYTPEPTDGSERMIDLTGAGIFDGAFWFDRYDGIRHFPYEEVEVPFGEGNRTVFLPKRLVTVAEATEIANDFDRLIAHVRSEFIAFTEDDKPAPTSPSQDPGISQNSPRWYTLPPPTRSAQQTFDLIESLLPEGVELRSAQETFDLIESLLPEGVELRSAQQTFDLIESLLPEGVELRSAQQTFDLIESLLPEGVELRSAQQTFDLIESLLPEGVELRSAQQTFDLIESLLPEGVELRSAQQTFDLIESLLPEGVDEMGSSLFIEFSYDNVVWFNLDRQYLFTRIYEDPDVFLLNVDADEAAILVSFGEIIIGFTASDQAIIEALDSEMHIRVQQGDSVFFEGDISVNIPHDSDTRVLAIENIVESGTFTEEMPVSVIVTLESTVDFVYFRVSDDGVNWLQPPTMRTAAQTYALIQSLLDYDDLQNKPRIPTPLVRATLANLPSAANALGDVLYGVVDSDDAVQRIQFKTFQDLPFFAVTVADLGDGHRGFAGVGYGSLDDGYDVDAGGTSGYSALGAISEHVRSLLSSTFERVSTYTLGTSSIPILGIATNGTNLYYIEDTGSSTRIRGINPETGANVFTGGSNSDADDSEGLAIVGEWAYSYDRRDQNIFRWSIVSSSNEELFTSIPFQPSGRGLASDGTDLWFLYINNNQDAYLEQINPTNGSSISSTRNRLTGFANNDRQINVEGFGYLNGVYYITTRDGSGSQLPHLYRVDVSTAVLTDLGLISPSNADFEGFTGIGEFAYVWNSTDRGIYRSESPGNRWEVVFPDDTTEVDTGDTILKLFTESDGDEIELARNVAITDAVVFASEYDGATAHTISVGNSLSMALYKSDNTQLFDGALRAVYQELETKALPIGT